MANQLRGFLVRAAIALCLLTGSVLPAHANSGAEVEARNAALVRQAFDAWKQGRGSVFDMLSDRAEWIVAGSSPVSGVYPSRRDFLERAVNPITARLSTPIVPEVRHVVAQDDRVVVFWDGVATARNGARYENSYAWLMVLQGGKITKVTAYLDTWALAQLMTPDGR